MTGIRTTAVCGLLFLLGFSSLAHSEPYDITSPTDDDRVVIVIVIPPVAVAVGAGVAAGLIVYWITRPDIADAEIVVHVRGDTGSESADCHTDGCTATTDIEEEEDGSGAQLIYASAQAFTQDRASGGARSGIGPASPLVRRDHRASGRVAFVSNHESRKRAWSTFAVPELAPADPPLTFTVTLDEFSLAYYDADTSDSTSPCQTSERSLDVRSAITITRTADGDTLLSGELMDCRIVFGAPDTCGNPPVVLENPCDLEFEYQDSTLTILPYEASIALTEWAENDTIDIVVETNLGIELTFQGPPVAVKETSWGRLKHLFR